LPLPTEHDKIEKSREKQRGKGAGKMSRQEQLSLLQFQERFKDEESCREHLFKQRWPEGFICPKCGHKEYYSLPTRKNYQCKACKRQTSVTAGTVLHKTHTPLQKWFWAIY